MLKRSVCVLSTVAVLAAAAPAGAAQVLVNGGFESGLTGWTAYLTSANGTIAENPSTPTQAQPQEASVVSFNATGGGASNALFLNAGKISGFGAPREGGGVIQTFSTTGGVATFSANIASFYTRASGAVDLGLLSVLLDGVVLDSHDFGGVAAGPATLRSTLAFTTTLAAGDHTLALQATRLFAPARGVTSEYFDNASLNVVALPEPASWALMIAGFGGVGGLLRRRGALRSA